MIASRNRLLQSSFQDYPENDVNGARNTHIVRKFVNSAVYIETAIDVMPTYRQSSSSLKSQYSNEQSDYKVYKMKRCSCSVNPHSCPCHPFSGEDTSKSGNSTFSTESSKSDIDNASAATVLNINTSKELKLPLSALNSARQPSSVSEEERKAAVQNWLAKKEMERKKRELEEAKLREQKERERQAVLEKERENFKKWLANKKKEEEKKRKKKEIEIEEEKLREAEKEKRQIENQLSYQLWLKKKEELYLDRKIKEEINIIKLAEEREKRLAENERAFQEWCKNSKSKPKPVPLNQGLDSLKSSVSVSYINPIPWNSNVDREMKPSSQ